MSEISSSPSDVEKWSKADCIQFLKTINRAKLSGNKNELVHRITGYLNHPEILKAAQVKTEKTLSTSLDIQTLLSAHPITQWHNLPLPTITFNQVEKYLKTKKQGCQALQQKGYRLFASRKIVSVSRAVVDSKVVVNGLVRPSMQAKTARPLWITFHDDCPTFCKCPAGKSGLCCHVAAVLFALEENTRTGNMTLDISCTSKLQTWHRNKPWKGKLTETKNIRIISARNKVKKAKKIRKPRSTARLVTSSLTGVKIQRYTEFPWISWDTG